MNAYEKHNLNDRDGLDWVHRFGWLRTLELGALLWPGTAEASATRQANRLAKSWVKRGLVLERQLPENAGRALVLATGGVRVLAEHGIEATSGKDVGKLIDNPTWRPPLKYEPLWLPPLTWRHDLLAAGVLVDLHLRGYKVLPEATIRRHAGNLIKIPDGLAVKDKQVLWLEVESARKTGKAMRDLADALCAVSDKQAAAVLGHRPTHVLVAHTADSKDERGHKLSHRTRIRAAVAEAARKDVNIAWAACTLRGAAGVGAIEYKEERIQSDRAAAILKRMEWRLSAEEEGVWVASYGDRLGYIWEDDGFWGYQVEGRTGGTADSEAAAKRACAAEIASM